MLWSAKDTKYWHLAMRDQIGHVTGTKTINGKAALSSYLHLKGSWNSLHVFCIIKHFLNNNFKLTLFLEKLAYHWAPTLKEITAQLSSLRQQWTFTTLPVWRERESQAEEILLWPRLPKSYSITYRVNHKFKFSGKAIRFHLLKRGV